MELFTAGDVSQMETIKRWIDESDIYMLILGGRYGSIEVTSGLSYTELEYDYALQENKPSFSVVIREDALDLKVKSGGVSFLERINPSSLCCFRQKVLSNTSSFFSDSKDIKLCVYESMPDYVGNSALKGWVSGEEIENIQMLKDEIKRLKDDNTNLMVNSKIENTFAGTGNSSHLDVESVLKGIVVEVPLSLVPVLFKNGVSDGAPYTLYQMAYIVRHALLAGVSNKASSNNNMASFLFFNIFPKLQMHGLSDNESIPDTHYRRSFLNDCGKTFFSDVEKREILKKTNDAIPLSADTSY